jgi:hypothetical protein
MDSGGLPRPELWKQPSSPDNRASGVTLLVVTGKARSRWSMLAAGVIAVAALWVLYAVWQSPHRSDLATYGAFAVAVVALALGWIAWVWRSRTISPDRDGKSQELDDRADLLAEAVWLQWERAADERGLVVPEPIPVRWGRPALPMAGPAATAVASRRFDPLPGLPHVGEADLATGQIADLHTIYGGLGSGRLVIAGPAGSGKSGAAILLILTALRHRRDVASSDRPHVPVPLLFTAHDWDPVSQRVGDWLAARMGQTYPMFQGQAGGAEATALVATGKVALILDGLDEIAENLRPVALQALSQQASFRVVILSRTAEMASAASQQGILDGAAAVELCTIDPDTAADYLSRIQLDPPPDGWRDLIDRVRSHQGPLARVLDNPLTLTLVKDTYRSGDNVRELLDFCDTQQQRVPGDRLVEDTTGYLLDRILPAAYTPRLGEGTPPFNLQAAQRALTRIARQMNQDGSRDLQWWHLPKWAPAKPRILLGGVVVGLPVGLVVGVEIGLAAGLGAGLVSGFLSGPLAGLLLGIALRPSNDDTPNRIGKLQLRRVSQENLRFGLWMGFFTGVASGLFAGVISRLVVGFVVGVVLGLVVGVVLGLADALADPKSTSSLSPLTAWHEDKRYALGLGLTVGLAFGLVVGLPSGLAGGVVVGVVTGVVTGLVFGLFAALSDSPCGSSSLAAAQLARRWNTPVHLMRFLEDARERGVLRTVGAVYQFRHARLQDRLAGQDNSSS